MEVGIRIDDRFPSIVLFHCLQPDKYAFAKLLLREISLVFYVEDGDKVSCRQIGCLDEVSCLLSRV